MAKTTEITDADFAEAVQERSSQIPVLVDYWADWCGPCRQLAPLLEKLAEKYEGKVEIVKLDTVANTETPAARGVMGLPTLELWVGGEVVATTTGSQSPGKLSKMIDEVV